MGVRKGQGYGVPKPKRARCPECGKKGVKQWYVTAHGLYRDCQYCQHTWGELSWKIATSTRDKNVGTPSAAATLPSPAQSFLDATKGIAGHHVIAVMNIATPGVEWRRCSKKAMADDYALVMGGKRFTLASEANDGMRRLNLEALRRAALERQSGNRLFADHYEALPT